MELGTGIFLSAVVIALVMLYSSTKDRWKWRQLFKRTAYFCLGLVLLGSFIAVGTLLYEQIPTPIGRQTEYAGIRLSMTMDEVLYVKGNPTSVVTDEEIPDPQRKGFYHVIETSKLGEGKSVRNYARWSYSQRSHNIFVTFNETRAAVVAIHCYSEDKLGRCPAIAGIDDGDSENKVLQKLGQNPKSSISGTTKTLTYSELGVRLQLTKEAVYLLEVSSPGFRP